MAIKPFSILNCVAWETSSKKNKKTKKRPNILKSGYDYGWLQWFKHRWN